MRAGCYCRCVFASGTLISLVISILSTYSGQAANSAAEAGSDSEATDTASWHSIATTILGALLATLNVVASKMDFAGKAKNFENASNAMASIKRKLDGYRRPEGGDLIPPTPEYLAQFQEFRLMCEADIDQVCQTAGSPLRVRT